MSRHSRHWLALWTLGGLIAASGASCPQLVPQYGNPLPRVLPPSPNLAQVIQAVNANSAQIQSFESNRAQLSGQGFSMRASVAFERPRRFRLRGETALLGPEIDLGSNDELFWFWIRRSQPPALYFCRHDQFATCPARQDMPFDPQWLIEALGVVEFDPSLPQQGPYPLSGDRLQIRTIRETPQGPQTKITTIDAIRATVLQQQIYGSRGQLLASADSSNHRRDPLSGLIMATTVTVQSVPAQTTLRLDLGKVEINRLSGANPGLWAMPNYPGAPAIDLCAPYPQTAPQQGPPQQGPPQQGPPPGGYR